MFEAYIYLGNSRGTGFFSLPDDISQKFNEGEQVLVTIHAEKKAEYYARIRKWRGLGVYVPKRIAAEKHFLQKTFRIEVEKVDGFRAKVSQDGQLYLPLKRAQELDIREGRIVEVEGTIEGDVETKYWPVNFRKKKNTPEYQITFNRKYAGKEGIFKIKEVFEPSTQNEEITEDLREVLNGLDWIVKNSVVRVFNGNKIPVTISGDLSLKDLSYYLGAFFADGTKKGNSWGIVASTFRQANFYEKNHRSIFKDVDFYTELTYTFHPSSKINKKRLFQIWKEKTGIEIDSFQGIKTGTVHAENRNKFGSLYFREHKLLVKEIYNRMLNILLEKITEEQDRELAWDFILGVMEGDGAANARNHGHITITTNKNESKKLNEVFRALELKGRRSKNGGKYYIKVGSLELISNLKLIGDKLFRFYLKRRRKAAKRLLKTGAARYLLGKSEETSGWIKAYFQEKEMLDHNYELTEKGLSIKRELKKLLSEVT